MTDPFARDVEAVQGIAAVPNILDVVCRTTGMGFAAVARVTEDRWIACSVQDNIAFGLQPGGELKVESTICHEIRQSGTMVVIDHVAEDIVFKSHHTPQMYGFQSYISVPIVRVDGRFFGTLCAIDPGPARLNKPEVIGMFKLFADMIAFHLDAYERLSESSQSLAEERHTAELREQFIAVLGHDLRNPLAAIQGGMRLLEKTALEPAAKKIVGLIDASVWRMVALIDDVMDFTRGRMGGGLALNRRCDPIEPVLRQVLSELAVAHPSRSIEASFHFDHPVVCDPTRIGQLLSNLAANALTHGESDAPVMVEAWSHKRGI